MADSVDVQTWSLDDLVYRQRPDRKIVLLKIDVEGYEPQVLAGAIRTLREMRPWVMCEFNDVLLRDAGSSAEELLQLFASLAYFPILEPGNLTGKVTDVLLGPVPRLKSNQPER